MNLRFFSLPSERAGTNFLTANTRINGGTQEVPRAQGMVGALSSIGSPPMDGYILSLWQGTAWASSQWQWQVGGDTARFCPPQGSLLGVRTYPALEAPREQEMSPSPVIYKAK